MIKPYVSRDGMNCSGGGDFHVGPFYLGVWFILDWAAFFSFGIRTSLGRIPCLTLNLGPLELELCATGWRYHQLMEAAAREWLDSQLSDPVLDCGCCGACSCAKD